MIDEAIYLYSIAVVGKDGKYYEYLGQPRHFILTGEYTDDVVLLNAGPIREGELRILNSTAEGLPKSIEVTTTSSSNHFPDFVYVVSKDNDLILISSYNAMFISEKRDELLSFSPETSDYKSLLLGLEEEIYPTRISGFGLGFMSYYNFGSLYSFSVQNNNTYEFIQVSSENAIPVRKLEATALEELEIYGFKLFDEYTTCTITSKGLQESFQAIGYNMKSFDLGEPELIFVVREIQGSYYSYAIPVSECIIQSKNLDIRRNLPLS